MRQPRALDHARMQHYLLQGLGCAALATAAVLLATTGKETLQHLRNFPLAVLPLLFGMIVASWCANAARVWLMCRAVGHRLRVRQAIAVTLMSEFGVNATPAGVGGSILRLSLLRRAGVPFGTGGGLLATDAAIDALVLVLLSLAGLGVLLRQHLLDAAFNAGGSGGAALLLFALVATCFALFHLLRRRSVQQAIERAARATRLGRRHRLAARLRHARRTLPHGLRRARSTLGFLWRERKSVLLANCALALLQCGCRYLVLPVVIWSFGIEINPLPLVLAQGMLFMLSLMLVVPGGGGSVELLSAVILPGIVPAEIVGVVVLVWRFFTYHLYVIGGATAFFWLSRRLQRVFPGAFATAYRAGIPASPDPA